MPILGSLARFLARRSRNRGPKILLSGLSASEDASVADDIGVLSVRKGSGTYTFSIAADPDSKFQLNVDGVTLEVGAALDYETATSHLVTIEADNGVDAVLSRQFVISVIDVFEPSLDFQIAANSQYIGQLV